MTSKDNATRSFSVHARSSHARHAHEVQESSFEAAAVAYVEDHHSALHGEPEISVIVRDLGSGHEHCFRIDLDTGTTASCG